MAAPDQEHQPYVEYISRELSEPVLQGDVFSWQETGIDPWRQFGIIVTADCDLANKKFGDSMSYCPILRLHDFLRLFWVSKDLDKQRQKIAAEIAVQLTKARRENRPTYTEPVSPDSLPRWLELRGIEGILKAIEEPDGKRHVTLTNQLTTLKCLIDTNETNELFEQIEAIAKARIPVSHTTPTSVQDDINNQIYKIWSNYTDRVSGLSGDLFFLNELSPSHKEGYIVYLRRITEISPLDIATTPFMARTSKALRISHLRSVIKYRITQKLAAVFSDIGLPTEYENMCRDKMRNTGLSLNVKNL